MEPKVVTSSKAFRPTAESLIDATRVKPIDDIDDKVDTVASALCAQFEAGRRTVIDPSEIAIGLTSATARFIDLARRDENPDRAFFRGAAALSGAIDGLEGFGHLAGSDTGAEGVLAVLRELFGYVQKRDPEAAMAALDRRLDARGLPRDREPPPAPAALQKRPHPADAAVAALSELAAELLTSSKPSRFVEIQRITAIAAQVQQLRPMTGVDDFHRNDNEFQGVVAGGIMPMPRFAGGDLGDINREMIMLIQGFLEAEKGKHGRAARGLVADELATLTEVRLQLLDAEEPVPEEINRRIARLTQLIGEPDHEPDPALHPLPVRRREADGAGRPDGDRVGEALPE